MTMAALMVEILMQTTSSGLSLEATVEDTLSIPVQILVLEISFSNLVKTKEHAGARSPAAERIKLDPQSPPDAHIHECLSKSPRFSFARGFQLLHLLLNLLLASMLINIWKGNSEVLVIKVNIVNTELLNFFSRGLDQLIKRCPCCQNQNIESNKRKTVPKVRYRSIMVDTFYRT